jgi:hypothetical protein
MSYDRALNALSNDQRLLNSEDFRGQIAYGEFLLSDCDSATIRRKVCSQYGAACAHILRRVETGRILRDSPASHRDPIVRGVSRIRATAAGSTPPDLGGGYWSRDALEDAVEAKVQSILVDRASFRTILEQHYATLPAPHANRLRRLVTEISTGLGMAGIDLTDAMRNARNEALEFVSTSDRERYAIAWFLLGWLCLHGAFCADATSHFANGLNVIGERSDFLTYLLNRYLALSLDINDRRSEAYETVKVAIALRTEPTVLVEASRYSARSGHSGEAWRFVETAIRLNPMASYEAMAEDDLASVEGAILVGYGQALETVKKRSVVACDEWEAAIDEVRSAETRLGTTLELANDMMTGVKQLRRDLEGAELSEAFGICTSARFVRRELLESGVKRIKSLVSNKDSYLTELTRQRAQTMAKIDSKLNRQRAEFEACQKNLHLAARAADPNGELVAAGYGAAAKSALLILIGFPIIVRVSAIFGHPLPSNEMAMLALGLLFVPILAAMGTQFAMTLRQSTAEAGVKHHAQLLEKRYLRDRAKVEQERAAKEKDLDAVAATLDNRSSIAADAIRQLKAIAATCQDPLRSAA